MADYKELLRKAVEALPENNGAARRAVYEKARAALVGQLRAINPPLPARDITTHRLQLEDCIRQVEQEASEAVIAGMGGGHADTPPPVYFEAQAGGKAQPALAKPAKPAGKTATPTPPKALPAGGSIEDIIAAANADVPAESKPAARPANRNGQMRLAAPAEPDEADAPEAANEPDILPPKGGAKPNGKALPSIVARAEAAKRGSHGNAAFDLRRAPPTIEPSRPAPRFEPAARGNQLLVPHEVVEPITYADEPQVAAMSAVREVEVEADHAPADPQGAIDRAIATLDREARGDAPTPEVNGFDKPQDEKPSAPAPHKAPGRKGQRGGAAGKAVKSARGREALAATGRRGRDEAPFPRAQAERERGGMSPISIFLIVFAVLLAGAGGAGYWAVSQGYLDLSTMFGSSNPQAVVAAAPAATVADPGTPATGPGNTAAPVETPVAAEIPGEARLTPEPALTGSEPLALAASSEAAPSEERLVAANDAATAEAAVAALDPANLQGSQSLLLEASDDGTTGAVPFSGTVEWSKGTDETGQPTLVGKANVPARNLGVDVLIRRNADPQLPASHLMEINFRVTDTFVGGSIAGLPGVLLKNEELVQGTPLVGASARVVGNSFLFALSASPNDLTNNAALLTGRKWMDLALIYATGKRAIITLEKDAAAEALFKEVFAAWGQLATN